MPSASSHQDPSHSRPRLASNKPQLTIMPRSLSSNSLVSIGAVSPTNVTAMDRLPRERSTSQHDASLDASHRVATNKSSTSLCLTADNLQYYLDEPPFGSTGDRSSAGVHPHDSESVVSLPDGTLGLGFSTDDGIRSIQCSLGVRSRVDLLSLVRFNS